MANNNANNGETESMVIAKKLSVHPSIFTRKVCRLLGIVRILFATQI